jgi:hypothetical protein
MRHRLDRVVRVDADEQPFPTAVPWREFYDRWLDLLLHPTDAAIAQHRRALFAKQPTRRWYR